MRQLQNPVVLVTHEHVPYGMCAWVTRTTVAAERFCNSLMYVQLLPYVEPPHHASDGCHPEGGARRVIAEITASLPKGGFEHMDVTVRPFAQTRLCLDYEA